MELVEALAVVEVRGGEKARDAGGGKGDDRGGSQGGSGFEGVGETRAGGTAVALEAHTGGSWDGDAEGVEFFHYVKFVRVFVEVGVESVPGRGYILEARSQVGWEKRGGPIRVGVCKRT